MISAVDNSIIWGMSGTTSGTYCQQWTAICSATYVHASVMPLFNNKDNLRKKSMATKMVQVNALSHSLNNGLTLNSFEPHYMS